MFDWFILIDDDLFGDGDFGMGCVDYWFGECDWSVNIIGDGFEGLSVLWVGV